MTGIIPDASKGGVAVVDGGGNPTNPPGVTNAYVPALPFTTSCTLRYYGSDCPTTRYDPQQINAFQSEMICLAEKMDPDGAWSCDSLCNLGAAFSNFADGIQPALQDCAGDPLPEGTQVATCDDLFCQWASVPRHMQINDAFGVVDHFAFSLSGTAPSQIGASLITVNDAFGAPQHRAFDLSSALDPCLVGVITITDAFSVPEYRALAA